jgi:hypothetical protein
MENIAKLIGRVVAYIFLGFIIGQLVGLIIPMPAIGLTILGVFVVFALEKYDR